MLVSFPFHDLSTSAFGEEKKTTLLLRSFFNDPKVNPFEISFSPKTLYIINKILS